MVNQRSVRKISPKLRATDIYPGLPQHILQSLLTGRIPIIRPLVFYTRCVASEPSHTLYFDITKYGVVGEYMDKKSSKWFSK